MSMLLTPGSSKVRALLPSSHVVFRKQKWETQRQRTRTGQTGTAIGHKGHKNVTVSEAAVGRSVEQVWACDCLPKSI